MMEIYNKFSTNYDELVTAEDYEENLATYLKNVTSWKNKIVYEAGIGTGRITKIYIDKIKTCYGFDREQHMLTKCSENLLAYKNRLQLKIANNEELLIMPESADIFIEGWSFGHTIVENEKFFKETFESIYNKINKILDGRGMIVIIESLGTNVTEPTFPLPILKDFYALLEDHYTFKRTTLRTDYKYTNHQEAARIMGFFFGDWMKDNIQKTKKSVIEEYTGVWIKELK